EGGGAGSGGGAPARRRCRVCESAGSASLLAVWPTNTPERRPSRSGRFRDRLMRIRMSVTAAALALLLVSRPASALDPRARITRYRHTAWRGQDGAFDSTPNAITQTTNGSIWIGNESGLVPFGGVRFPPAYPA